MNFLQILRKYNEDSFSQRDKGQRFEALMKSYLLTDPKYTNTIKEVYLWQEFPYKESLGSIDTGIDLVALTFDNEYWAVQCKFFSEDAYIDKSSVDTFLATSSKEFVDSNGNRIVFSNRLWISTTNNWSSNAEEAIKNQNPPVTRINLHDLIEAQVDWEKLYVGLKGESARAQKKELREYQIQIRDKVCEYFKTNDRGILVMACGTGKTITSLKIAEKLTNSVGTILFLVPSIALIGQTLREWTQESTKPINPICVCSDPEITKKKNKTTDIDSTSVVDLAWPASTNVERILQQFKYYKNHSNNTLTVVFSTYQSIDVIAHAQKVLIENGFSEFDLIICDEAHRTTGYTEPGTDDSAFVKVHNNDFIRAKKRLYMTATPRLYNIDAKSTAAKQNITLWSMDDEKSFGKEIHRLGFGEAVEKGLLTDYKVIILTLSDRDVPPAVQRMISQGDVEIKTDDLTKIVGTINALSKQFLGNEVIKLEGDESPMKSAVAFCGSISDSKKIGEIYNKVSESYLNALPEKNRNKMVNVCAKHIDGSMPAPKRDEMLTWLKGEVADRECRILTNVKVLSEGVDVPSLDAVLFLSAKNSYIDVVQSVGRVMRKAPGKKYGYVVIPVVVPVDVEPEKALDDNERYKVVWSVLNALRAHDDRFNAIVNKIELNKNKPKQILVGTLDMAFDEDGNFVDKKSTSNTNSDLDSPQLYLQFQELQNIVFARLVTKVGDKRYWENWAADIAIIAERQVERIKYLISQKEDQRIAFENFLNSLKKSINSSIDEDQAIEMLSQHLITQPVFDALFENYSFVKNNAVSIAMQNMVDALESGNNLAQQDEVLQSFYESVRKRAQGIDNPEGKQRIIIELYDKFFKIAFPKMAEKLGIVYTPIEVVDFILHSVNDILQKEFNKTLSDENIHILDPFTGTGTFIVRLLQSGLIKPSDLEHKYRYELHANEIVLLAYYIAAVNIENAYHDATPDPDDGIGKSKYIPFDGIVFTDTFQLSESDDAERFFGDVLKENSEKVERQKNSPIRVIIGNPPYSVGQKSANDNNQNIKYPKLEKRIEETYVKHSTAGLNKSLYDSYIKAFRWSTDRLDKTGGIICFVSNGAWLDGNSTDGFRKSIEKEFTSIYVFNLRGNARTVGEQNRKEGEPLFGATGGKGGSKTPIAITLLVKNPNKSTEKATIYYYDIGDYLKRKQKLEIIKKFQSFSHLPLQILQPNQHGDWISQRNSEFETFIPLEPEKKFDADAKAFFSLIVIGVATNRDAWVYNFSKEKLTQNMQNMIEFYNEQCKAFALAKKDNPNLTVENFIDTNPQKISWTRALRKNASKNLQHLFTSNNCVYSLYRPFTKQYLYYDRNFIESPGLWSKLFPTPDAKNWVICISGLGVNKDFSVIITDVIADIQIQANAQCFPLYYYEEVNDLQVDIFGGSGQSRYVKRDGISDFILDQARQHYGKNVTKEDIFYYVYGFLHSKEYREKFANDLKKMLPRLPLVEGVEDFWAFSKAGRQLAELHLNYESVPPHPQVAVIGAESQNFQVSKMRFLAKDRKDVILYNNLIRIENIPLQAYEYVVNGKPAVEWVMERYQVTQHKESGIINDPNDWAKEIGNPRYILDLLLSIINVSVETIKIIESLPKLNFDNNDSSENLEVE